MFPKGHGVAINVGHLKRAFVLFLNDRIMNEINLVPLAEMLNVEGFSASEMSNLFDELVYDYAKTVIELQMADLSPRIVLHEKTDQFLHVLRELRDIFRQCDC